jgi:hypothetical protein
VLLQDLELVVITKLPQVHFLLISLKVLTKTSSYLTVIFILEKN